MKQLCFFVSHQLCQQGYTQLVMDAVNAMFDVYDRCALSGN